MKMQLIRNATLRLNYAGHTIVIDPYLAPKHALPSYTGASPNPLVDLPIPEQAVIDGAELVVVSHLHSDHFDKWAQDLLPKDTPIFCQPGDETVIQGKGFGDVTALTESVNWHNISINRTSGRHGTSEAVLRDMGKVSGFVLMAADEPTVYWAGDTVWYDEIEENIRKYQPDIVITHSGGAVWGDNELIIMDAQQTVTVCKSVPAGIVVATHLEALDHCLTSRTQLREVAQKQGIQDKQLLIPADGATLEF